MTHQHAFNVLLTGGTLALLFSFAVSIMADKKLRGHLAGQLALGFIVTFVAFLVATSGLLQDVAAPVRLLLRLLDSPNLPLLWLFVLVVYRDHFVPDKRYWLAAGIYTLLMIAERLVEAGVFELPDVFMLTVLIASIALIAHLVVTLSRGHEGDLVEPRRQSRRAVIAVIIVGTTLSVIGTNLQDGFSSSTLSLISRFGVLLCMFVVHQYWSPLQAGRFLFNADASERRHDDSLTDRQQKHLTALEHLIRDERAYLQPDLSIKSVARTLGIGEHLLRPLINTHLGYRNFPSFLNHYRIEYAKGILTNAAKRDVQIARIANDAGFHSLSAFNRAFKTSTGITPTQFRDDTLKR